MIYKPRAIGRILLATLLATISIFIANPSTVAAEQEFASRPLKKLFVLHKKYLKLTPEIRTLFAPAYHLQSKSGDLTGVSMAYTLNGETIAIPIDDHSHIMLSPGPALLAANPMVVTNQPKGSMSLSASFEILLPRTTRYQFSDLQAALSQIKTASKKMFGFRALLGSQPKEICFIFGPADLASPASGMVTFPTGEALPLNVGDNGQMAFAPKKKTYRGTEEIILNRAPVRIEVCG